MLYANYKEDPKFDNCPSICGETGKSLDNFCVNCPVKLSEENFKSFTIDELKKTGKDWESYGFDGILNDVHLIAELDKTDPHNWSVKTKHLVNAWRGQLARYERLEREKNQPNP